MSENQQAGLHPEVLRLADELHVVDGTIAMSRERAVAWRDRARRWPADDRRAFALDLVVFARRLAQHAAAPAQEAIFLVAVLVAELVGDEGQARDLLERGGVSVKKSQALLGSEAPDLGKVGAKPPPGARSMLGLLKDKK